MTPVEERIDHEEAKRIAERFVTESAFTGNDPAKSNYTLLGRAYLDLLTEHSARERALAEVAHQIVGFSRTVQGDHPTVREIAKNANTALDFPATEPAQPATAVANDQSKLLPIVRTPSVDHAWDADERFGEPAQPEQAHTVECETQRFLHHAATGGDLEGCSCSGDWKEQPHA